MNALTPTPRTELHRLPKRGVYDRDAIHRILDEAFLCHVGFAVHGQPYVIPTSFGRSGDRLLIHGASTSRMLDTLRGGVPACVTVTLVDGLVLARSAFHHSMNYRSVVLLGTAVEIQDPAEKLDALRIITEHVAPGRWAQVRPPSAQELKATSVLVMPISEASAKVRMGPPIDDPEDLSLPCWAGEIPLRLAALAPVPDPQLAPGIAPPTLDGRLRFPR
jgi:uncharacterized protein